MIKSVGGVDVQPKHRLSCHCGMVVLELDLPNGIVNPRRCDCSICRRKGAIVASVPLSDIKIIQGAAALKLYQFNTNVAKHYFCSNCGIYTHHQRRSFPDQYGYNVGCLEGIDPFKIEPVPLNDGVNHPADRVQRNRHALKLVNVRGLTWRSSGAPTAGHQGPVCGTSYSVTHRALASCRRRPLNSTLGVTIKEQMDYFQGVVTEYLRATRSQFVNTEYMINLDPDGTYLKGRHWYCDAVAIDFSTLKVHLCEITYSQTLHSIGVRLQAWSNNWPSLVNAIRRDSSLDERWEIVPRVFLPQALIPIIEQKITHIKNPVDSSSTMPKPIVTALEEVVPWKYRSWNGKAFASDA